MLAHQLKFVRTTLSIDDDVLAAAKAIAESNSTSVGEVVSELARKGLAAKGRVAAKGGFPVFEVARNAQPITLAHVKKQEDEL